MKKRSALLIGPLLIFFLLSQNKTLSATNKDDIPYGLRKVLIRAQEAIDKKSYRNAEKILTSYLEDSSHEPHYLAYYLLGNAYYLENRTGDAYRSYVKAYELNRYYRPVCINLAKVCYDKKKYREAGDLFLQVYEISGKADPEFLYEAAVAYFQGKLYRRTKTVLLQLLSTAKTIKESWLKLSVYTYLELKDWNTAERYVLSLLKRNVSNASYWKLLAQVRLRKGDYMGTASSLEIAYRIDPPKGKQWKDLANIYFYVGIPLKAARCLTKAYGVNPSPRQLDEIAGAYARAHRLKDAVNYFEEAIKIKPTGTRYLEIAKLYYRNGMWEDAKKMLHKSITLNPRNGLAHLLLGYCSWQTDDTSMAIRELRKASKYRHYREQALTALDIIEETLNTDTRSGGLTSN